MFANSVEDVKWQIAKRRIKSEIKAKVKVTKEDDEMFEEAVVKLVNYAKGKIKYEDFTHMDKYNLVELFVTNDKTLLYIYRALF